MKSTVVLLCALALWAAPTLAQGGGREDAAYRKVRSARDVARRFPSKRSLKEFEGASKSYLKQFPRASRSSRVWLWCGDLWKATKPRDAWDAYRRSKEPAAQLRAKELAFMHEPPPEIRASGWVGEAVAPGTPSPDVTLVAFFSIAHPQTRDALELLIPWSKKPGMRVIGIASVVDNPNSQTPERLRRVINGYALPFPVALDEQRYGGKPSVSLGLYRGKRVPWMAVLDRHGRIRSIQGIPLKGNALTQTQHMLEQLLAEPGYEELRRDLIKGGKAGNDALETLATIRTERTAGLLLEAKGQIREKSLALKVDEVLTGLLPKGFNREQWASKRASMRYSLESDRLVG